MAAQIEVQTDKNGLRRWRMIDENGRRVPFRAGNVVGIKPNKWHRGIVQRMLAFGENG